jgi:hypothetical protein
MIFTEQPIYARPYIFTHVLWKFKKERTSFGLRIKELLIPIL